MEDKLLNDETTMAYYITNIFHLGLIFVSIWAENLS